LHKTDAIETVTTKTITVLTHEEKVHHTSSQQDRMEAIKQVILLINK